MVCFRLRGHDFEHLSTDAGVGARITLVGHQVDAVAVGFDLGVVVDQIAPCIAEADEADILELLRIHLVDDHAEHIAWILGDRNGPGFAIDLCN